MMNYKIAIRGSVGVTQVEIDDRFMSDKYAIENVVRRLKYYYPVFYSAALYEVSPTQDYRHVADFRSSVEVSTMMAPKSE